MPIASGAPQTVLTLYALRSRRRTSAGRRLRTQLRRRSRRPRCAPLRERCIAGWRAEEEPNHHLDCAEQISATGPQVCSGVAADVGAIEGQGEVRESLR